ncbi:MAG: hypothetical protein SF182_09270 [Deltaproteobacteria bacterium]|nr:hypothetical protein [Deltaproteobacteria bacterium]
MSGWYTTILLLHSWLRWGVLALGVWCGLAAARGWRQRAPFGGADVRRLTLFVAAVDTQLLLGLLLYAQLSPITSIAFGNLGAAMGNAVLRFFVLEHPLAMVSGVALLHVGSVRARRLGADPTRHRAVLRTIGLALLCVLIGIPWPGLPYARPLFHLPASRAAP